MQMTEAEVRGLCLKSREIFLQQSILLELEAPLKICGELTFIFFTFTVLATICIVKYLKFFITFWDKCYLLY